MPESVSFAKAYGEVLKSGLVQDEVIKQHVKEHETIDKILPNSSSFFYIVNPGTSKYHFLGKQQQNITGVKNEDLIKVGIEGFLQRIHPEEAGLVVTQIYRDFAIWFDEIKDEVNHADIVYQYNYRFRNGNDEYLNLMEHVHILEVDENHRASLLLGNVFVIENNLVHPVRGALKIYRKDEVIETLYTKSYTPVSSDPQITKREQDILRNLATGKTSKQIAKQLFISPHTVDTHRRNLLKKLRCSSVVELAQIAFQTGMM